MTGGGGLLGTLVIDFYVNDDNNNDKEPRIGIHTRATLLIVDELDTIHADGGVSFSLSLTLSCCLLMMMMRETESNDDASSGRGIRHDATRNRTGEVTYDRLLFLLIWSSVFFLFFSSSCLFFPIAYE